MAKHINRVFALVLALVIILSCTVLGNKLTDPATYSHTIEVLDKNRTTVLALTAASTAASAAVSALPDDICSPIAQELSEFTTCFLLILSVVYLEKYLLTILAYAACYVLIPVGCSALLINCFFPRTTLKNIGTKLAVFGVCMLLVIPTSVWVSDRINDVYAKSIEITVQSAGAVSENLIGEASEGAESSSSVIDEAKELLGDLSGSVAGVVEQFKNLLNRFIEATAVMLVTTCLIPIVVLLFFMWVVKTLFSVQLPAPPQLPMHKKHRHSHDDEWELD